MEVPRCTTTRCGCGGPFKTRWSDRERRGRHGQSPRDRVGHDKGRCSSSRSKDLTSAAISGRLGPGRGSRSDRKFARQSCRRPDQRRPCCHDRCYPRCRSDPRRQPGDRTTRRLLKIALHRQFESFSGPVLRILGIERSRLAAGSPSVHAFFSRSISASRSGLRRLTRAALRG